MKKGINHISAFFQLLFLEENTKSCKKIEEKEEKKNSI